MLERRLAAQLLAGTRPDDPVAVAERLLAIQAQDPRGARLAVRARTSGVSAADVDRALTVDRSLVVTWLNRGTLHLVRCEDYGWLHALTTPPLRTASARSLAQEGIGPNAAERAVASIERSLAEEGPLTRAQLRDRLAAAGVPTAGQALVQLLFLAALRGVLVRGPMAGRQHAYALVRDWLEVPQAPPRERALAELARRYLAGHGPADERDLAKWAGLPLRDSRSALAAIASDLVDAGGGLVDLKTRENTGYLPPPPRLLGAFEPVLLGWRSREPILGAHAARVTVGGVFRPFALVDGRAVATWRLAGGRVELEPFSEVSADVAAALERDAEDVMRFLGAAA
jgi:Winged helix DNA-binding domain